MFFCTSSSWFKNDERFDFVDVNCFQEKRLRSDVTQAALDGYTYFDASSDNRFYNKGAFIRNGITAANNLHDDFFQCLIIRTARNSIKVMSEYKPQSYSAKGFVDYSVEQVRILQIDVILGDLNKSSSHDAFLTLDRQLEFLNFKDLSLQPTH